MAKKAKKETYFLSKKEVLALLDYPYIARALFIAKLGNFRVSSWYNTNEINAADAVVLEKAYEDAYGIKFSKNRNSIKIELKNGENLGNSEIFPLVELPKGDFAEPKTASHQILINRSIEKLQVLPSEVDLIKEVAKIIALEQGETKEVCISHLAEAIVLVSIPSDTANIGRYQIWDNGILIADFYNKEAYDKFNEPRCRYCTLD